MKGVNNMEFLNTNLIRLLSKVTGGETLIDSYMKDDMSILIEKLESYGITNEEISLLIKQMSSKESDSYSNAQNMISNMYLKKLEVEVMSGVIKQDELEDRTEEFDSSVIHNKRELVGISNDKNVWNQNISWKPLAKENIKLATPILQNSEIIEKVA